MIRAVTVLAHMSGGEAAAVTQRPESTLSHEFHHPGTRVQVKWPPRERCPIMPTTSPQLAQW